MRNRTILLLMFISTLSLRAQNVQNERSFQGNVIRTVSMDYLLYLPEGFEAKPNETWPLLVFLHGSGERGNDLEKVKVHGPPKLIAQGKTFPFIVLSPQCPLNSEWDTETLFALIKHVASRYRVDEAKVYVTGLSMGGAGTWDLAMAHPEYFAAIAPVCGPVSRNYLARAEELKNMPIMAFHGAMDDVVTIVPVASMIKKLQDLGNPARLVIYPEANHDSWTATYDNPELYKWFLENSRK
ncbi:MAG: prolyl oligopeptidase family serine peptidase [Lentimicrobium sp.]|jgi:predicted peptidase|nr:prolyl oligopeptidase family serine peptidase [Lentimicrobium sp.]